MPTDPRAGFPCLNDRPSLSIIIVSWNVADFLEACLRSIYDTCPVDTEVLVVDSASTDNTVDRVRLTFPNARLLAQPDNVGFAKGNNIGLAEAHGDYLLLLNPDTELMDGAIDSILLFMDTSPEIGIAGPQTLNPDGTHQSTRRRFPSVLTAVFESTWMEAFMPHSLLESFCVLDADDDDTILVDWVQGSCLLARREVYEQIGGLDEGFMMYSEELDWCRRAKSAGWEVAYIGHARILHYGGQSSAQVPAQTHIRFNESKIRYFRKHHGWLAAELLRVVVAANFAAQLAIEAVKWLLGHKRSLRRERVVAYWQVLRSGLKGAL